MKVRQGSGVCVRVVSRRILLLLRHHPNTTLLTDIMLQYLFNITGSVTLQTDIHHMLRHILLLLLQIYIIMLEQLIKWLLIQHCVTFLSLNRLCLNLHTLAKKYCDMPYWQNSLRNTIHAIDLIFL